MVTVEVRRSQQRRQARWSSIVLLTATATAMATATATLPALFLGGCAVGAFVGRENADPSPHFPTPRRLPCLSDLRGARDGDENNPCPRKPQGLPAVCAETFSKKIFPLPR